MGAGAVVESCRPVPYTSPRVSVCRTGRVRNQCLPDVGWNTSGPPVSSDGPRYRSRWWVDVCPLFAGKVFTAIGAIGVVLRRDERWSYVHS